MPGQHRLPAHSDGAKLTDMVGAVIYVRVSTKEQTENLSLPTQLRACEDYCRRQGYEVLEIKSSFEIKLFVMYTLLPFLKRFKSKEKKSLRETNVGINAAERQNYFNKLTSAPRWLLQIFVWVHNFIYNFLSWIGVGEEMMVAARKVKDV